MTSDQAAEPTVGIEVDQPVSAITEDGWLILAVTKIWVDRKARRGNLDPSGGFTVTPPYGSELLLAIPVEDDPKEPAPKTALTLAQFEKRVLDVLSGLVDRITNVTPPGF